MFSCLADRYNATKKMLKDSIKMNTMFRTLRVRATVFYHQSFYINRSHATIIEGIVPSSTGHDEQSKGL
jgi:hypothetical protein